MGPVEHGRRGCHSKHVPGFAVSLVWATSTDTTVGSDVSDPTPTTGSYVPALGETRVLTVSFPPDSVMVGPDLDPAAAQAEQLHILPGLAELFETDDPGVHRTDSVDYRVVLNGHFVLDLSDGRTAQLTAGDVVVQNGTRHAWRNPGMDPATTLFVLVGVPCTAHARDGQHTDNRPEEQS
ncbi:cupin domain-containing protein [Streptomyces melanosporofaciens]|uniref:Cupin domain-containing protein n=1 Tax=Streptomyces melanosporofaciens TaxID=67327 RepID=A0A1H4KGS4_STRMJ|nr:cupin domain-containing protein [Streptomyces melanosporofaciens]SEB57446.1 Cupin domain-containing protein [Streptomyces melanosporofaciens]